MTSIQPVLNTHVGQTASLPPVARHDRQVGNLPYTEQVEQIANLPGRLTPSPTEEQEKLRDTFQSVVGETLFGQMLKSMRKTVGKTPYFHGGRAEEAFQQQLDQVLARKMSQTSSERLAGPMFELFTLPRK